MPVIYTYRKALRKSPVSYFFLLVGVGTMACVTLIPSSEFPAANVWVFWIAVLFTLAMLHALISNYRGELVLDADTLSWSCSGFSQKTTRISLDALAEIHIWDAWFDVVTQDGRRHSIPGICQPSNNHEFISHIAQLRPDVKITRK